MTRSLPLVAASLVGSALLSGCNRDGQATVLRPQGATGGTTGSAAGGNGAVNSPSNAAPNASSGAPRDAAKPADLLSVDSLAPELRNEAFEYYGLGRKIPITMTLTSDGGPQTGSQDVRLLKATPEEAQFEITSTDGLNLFGRNVVSLRADGIRIQESEVIKTNGKDFELPNNLAPGNAWSMAQSVEDGSRAMRVTIVQKVVGAQPLTTKVATYPDALYVSGEGNGTFQGKPIKMITKSWFVKGRSNVKQVIASIQSGKTSTTTIEESK